MAATPPRASAVPPPPSPITAITSEIAMHLGRANSLLASASPTKGGARRGAARRINTPRVRRGGDGENENDGYKGDSSIRLDFSEKSSEGVLGTVPAFKTNVSGGGESAEIARLAQIIEQLSNTVEAQQRENQRLSSSLNTIEGRGASTDRSGSSSSSSDPASSLSSTTEAERAARGMGGRRGSVFGRRETLAGVRELLSMEKKNLGLLLVFGVLLAAVLAKLLLSYEEDPLY